jgi:hypothetical protein
MSNTVTTRILGFLLFLAGIPFTIWLFWLIRTDSTINYHVVMPGPMLSLYGWVLMILGRNSLRNPDGTRSLARSMLFTIPAAIVLPVTLNVARKSHDFLTLEHLLDSFTQKAAPPEHVVTREEVDAAIKEVNDRAAELQKVRASLNTSDAAAVKKFNLDTAAYTEHNHAAAALQAKFTAQAAK